MRQLAHCDDSTRRTHTRVLPLTLASQSKMSGERLEFCAEQLAGCSLSMQLGSGVHSPANSEWCQPNEEL